MFILGAVGCLFGRRDYFRPQRPGKHKDGSKAQDREDSRNPRRFAVNGYPRPLKQVPKRRSIKEGYQKKPRRFASLGRACFRVQGRPSKGFAEKNGHTAVEL